MNSAQRRIQRRKIASVFTIGRQVTTPTGAQALIAGIRHNDQRVQVKMRNNTHQYWRPSQLHFAA